MMSFNLFSVPPMKMKMTLVVVVVVVVIMALLVPVAQGFTTSKTSTTTTTMLTSRKPPVQLHGRTIRLWLSEQLEEDFGQETAGAGSTSATTYAQCGRCQSSYVLREEDLGPTGKGRRLECTVCGHSWFQSKDRLMTLGEGYELVPLPMMDLDRIATNLKEGKAPKYTGDSKLYVGNISFDSTEEDLIQLFSSVGECGSVSLVRDDLGRNRGFGFVVMRTKEDGDAAIEKLNGMEWNGRTIAVRESNN